VLSVFSLVSGLIKLRYSIAWRRFADYPVSGHLSSSRATMSAETRARALEEANRYASNAGVRRDRVEP